MTQAISEPDTARTRRPCVGHEGKPLFQIFDSNRRHRRWMSAVLAGCCLWVCPLVAQTGPEPVAHWPFDDGSGDLATDLGVYGLDASLVGHPIWTSAGQAGGALELSGVSDHVQVPSQFPLDLTHGLTLSLWVRPGYLGHQMLISKDDSYELEIGWRERGAYSLRLNNQRVGQGATPLEANRWQHLAATFDGQRVTFFYNGSVDGSVPFADSILVTASDLGLGARPSPQTAGGPTFFFRGALDDVRLFPEALTEAEIADLVATTQSDLTPPIRFGPVPYRPLPYGTTETLLGLRTDEPAFCRYGEEPGAEFEDMAASFLSGDGTSHEIQVSGLEDDAIVDFYVRCRDLLGNENSSDFRLFVAVSSDVDLASGLAAHWPLDAGQGCVAFDASDQGHDGSLLPGCPASGPIWIAGPNGPALSFSGGHDRVEVPAAEALDGPTALTLSAWVRHPPTGGFRALVDKRDRGTDGFDLYLDANSRAFVRVNDAVLAGQRVVADDQWHHVTAVYDGVDLRLYVDGEQDASSSVGHLAVDTEGDLKLGHHFSSTTNFTLQGDLRDVRFYDRALSDVEILSLVWFSSSDLSPQFVAEPRSGEAPLTVQFSDLSTSGDGSISAWHWDFENDGTVDSNLQHPQHTYLEAGTYSVGLTISDGAQSRRVVRSDYIEVGSTPPDPPSLRADFSADVTSGVAPLSVQFTDRSVAVNTSIVSYQWDLDGDGSVDSEQQHPIYEYEVPGTYAVSLTVSDGTLSDTLTRTAWIEASGISDGSPVDAQRVNAAEGGFTGSLDAFDRFGSAVAVLGDVNGDGVTDVAVGAPNDDDGGDEFGAVWILFMASDGTVASQQKLSGTEGNLFPAAGTILGPQRRFGSVLASPGDVDGDGVPDLAVGMPQAIGQVLLLLLEADGTVREVRRIGSSQGGFTGALDNDDRFGSAVAGLGDVDGDGVSDLAITAPGDDAGGFDVGALWIVFMNADGSVKDQQKISALEGGFRGDVEREDIFGQAVATIGDVDGDGIAELAVSAHQDNDGGTARGAVWILFLDAAGIVRMEQKLSATSGDFYGILNNVDGFGISLGQVGDLDGDGVPDLLAGASRNSGGGAAWIVFLNVDGTAKGHRKLSASEGAVPGTLREFSQFGAAVAGLGDLDGNGVAEMLVGQPRDNVGATQDGSAWVIFFDGPLPSRAVTSSFVAQPQRGLAPLEVQFEEQTKTRNTSITSFQWDFDGDGAIDASQPDPVHVFSDAGRFDVSLRVSDGDLEAQATRRVTALRPIDGSLRDSSRLLASDAQIRDFFGSGVAEVGDLDGDGINELAVGAPCDDDNGDCTGSLWIYFLDASGAVRLEQKISPDFGGFTEPLGNNDLFGSSVAPIGDLDGDGVPDLAVGARGDREGSVTSRGAVWILFLRPDGTVRDLSKINAEQGDVSSEINEGDAFGIDIASLGDLDDDGVVDLLVGGERGPWILFLRPNGTVHGDLRFRFNHPIFEGRATSGDGLGSSVANLGDLDGDGVVDIAIGAPKDDTEGNLQGAVWILFLRADGSAKAAQRIGESEGGFAGDLDIQDFWGSAMTAPGDLDGDGVPDLIVAERTALWFLTMQADGTVRNQTKLDAASSSLDDTFAVTALSTLGDLDGDEHMDLAVGSFRDDTVAVDAGATWILFLDGPPLNIPPSLVIGAPALGDQTSGSEFLIRWQDGDPEDDASIDLYYDVDGFGADGQLIVSGLRENQSPDEYLWDVSQLPPGDYFVYGVIQDGVNPPQVHYSSAPLSLVFAADAGVDQTVPVGSLVDLDGTQSSRLDEVELTWTLTELPVGSEAQLVNADSPRPSFLADLPGRFTVELETSGLYEDSALVTFTVEPSLTTVLTFPLQREQEVALTRETHFTFSSPLAEGTEIDDSTLHAMFGGQTLATSLRLSGDRRRLTVFYQEPLPSSARVRVTLRGNALFDAFGQAVDADGDGQAGGSLVLDFDTSSTRRLAGTDVWGRVFDAYDPDQPIVGATIRVDGFPEANAVTDAEGRFLLEDMPAPLFFVHIDGSTATNAPAGAVYPVVGKTFKSVAGQSIQLTMDGEPFDIFLPPMALGDSQALSSQSATEVGFGAVGTAQLMELFPTVDPAAWAQTRVRIEPGSAIDETGAVATQATILPVPPDRLPGPLPSGLQTALVISIQAEGATNFDLPASVCFPNLPNPTNGVAAVPGDKAALMSFDHDAGRWVMQGTMTVSSDGLMVCTDAGVGVSAPGWHTPIFPVPFSPSASVQAQDDADEITGWEPSDGFFTSFYRLVQQTDRPCNRFTGNNNLDEAIENYHKYRSCVNNAFQCAGQTAINAANLPGTITGGPLRAIEDVTDFLISELVIGLNEAYGNENTPLPFFVATALQQDLLEVVDSHVPTSFLKAQLRVTFDAATAKPLEVGDGAQLANLSAFDFPAVSSAQLVVTEIEGPNQVLADLAINVVEQISLDLLATLTDNVPGNAPPYPVPYVATVVGPSGTFELRGETGPLGNYQLFLPTDGTLQAISFHDPKTNAFGVTLPVGNRRLLPQFTLVPVNEAFLDSDGDGLVDLAEPVHGTAIDDPDTDDDGVLDGAEVVQGTDPLGGLQVTTGIIAGADTPGNAVDVCALDDLAIVADEHAGIAVFDISAGESPTRIAQVAIPGRALAVTCDDRRVAVAAGQGGLAIVDLIDPPAASIVHTVSFAASAEAVALTSEVAHVGLDSGELVSIDLATGSELRRLFLGGVVHDVVARPEALYVLTTGQLHALPLHGDGAVVTVPSPGQSTPLSLRMRLFAGADVLYAVHSQGYNTFDLADPLAPSPIAPGSSNQFGWKDLSANGNGLGLAVVGPNSFGISNLSLYDVSDPAQTDAFLTQFVTPGVARAVDLYNGLAYVADGTAGLQVVNYAAFDAQGQAPTVTLSTNYAPGVAEAGQVLELTADAADDVQVRQVEFLVDGAVALVDGNFPFGYRFVAPTLAEQSELTVQARATDTGGNVALSDELVLSLTADAIAPQVLANSPEDDGQAFDANVVTVTFSEPMDPGSINSTSFQLRRPGPDQVFDTADDLVLSASSITFRDDVLSAFMTFSEPLAVGRYRATLTSSVTDIGGNGLEAEHRWFFDVVSFTTMQGRAVLPDQTVAAGAEVTVRHSLDSQVVTVGIANDSGYFTLQGVPVLSHAPELDVLVRHRVDGEIYSTRQLRVTPSVEGVTDLGTLTLRFLPSNYLVEETVLPSDGLAATEYGAAVVMTPNIAVVGAPSDDTLSPNAGAVYVQQRFGERWVEVAKLQASDASDGARFGSSLAISDDLIVVGAPEAAVSGFIQAGAVYVFRLVDEIWTEEARLIAGDPGTIEGFGCSVALDGTTLVVGAPYDTELGTLAGAVYVFEYDGTGWVQEDKLAATETQSGHRFGAAVALDGDTLVVGARSGPGNTSQSGVAHVFQRNESNWNQLATLTAPDGFFRGEFGMSVAVEGDTAVIGSQRGAYVFQREGSDWPLKTRLLPLDHTASFESRFGASVALRGDDILVGDPGSDGSRFVNSNEGAAYVFRRFGDRWAEHRRMVAPERTFGQAFGTSVTLSGEVAWVGAPLAESRTGLFTADAEQPLTDVEGMVLLPDASPAASATVEILDADGRTLSLGETGNDGRFWLERTPIPASVTSVRVSKVRVEGTVETVFFLSLEEIVLNTDGVSNLGTLDLTTRQHTLGKAEPSINDRLGQAVALEGNTALVGSRDFTGGAFSPGAVHVYERSGDTWTETAQLRASDGGNNDRFGNALDLNGEWALIGAHNAQSNGIQSGAAYLFQRQGGTWTQHTQLLASAGSSGDFFGDSVALDGSYALVGAYSEDLVGLRNAGAAYVFSYEGGQWTEQARLVASDAEAEDRFGASVALSGDVALIGAPRDQDGGLFSGAVYVFERSGDQWIEVAKLTANDAAAHDNFGTAVAVDGHFAVIGADGDGDQGRASGSAYIFERVAGIWQQRSKLLASDGRDRSAFGQVVAITGDRAAVGAPNFDGALINAGAVYIFERQGINWVEQRKVEAFEQDLSDDFGTAVALSGTEILVGAPGVGPGTILSGAAYVIP